MIIRQAGRQIFSVSTHNNNNLRKGNSKISSLIGMSIEDGLVVICKS